VILAMLLPASLQGKLAPQPETVIGSHDFEVQDFHTYFVGEAGVWVHNRGWSCELIEQLFTSSLKGNQRDLGKAFDESLDVLGRSASTADRQRLVSGFIDPTDFRRRLDDGSLDPRYRDLALEKGELKP